MSNVRIEINSNTGNGARPSVSPSVMIPRPSSKPAESSTLSPVVSSPMGPLTPTGSPGPGKRKTIRRPYSSSSSSSSAASTPDTGPASSPLLNITLEPLDSSNSPCSPETPRSSYESKEYNPRYSHLASEEVDRLMEEIAKKIAPEGMSDVAFQKTL